MTRHEAELREIERLRDRPSKGEKVTPAMLEHLRLQRKFEKDRQTRTQELGPVIKLSWVEGEPKKWDSAIAQVVIGGVTRAVVIEPYEEVDGKQRLKPKIVTKGYSGMAEAWALWKWHCDRGSEVDDADNYILDCDPPKFEWEVVVKRGRPAKETA